MKTFEQWLLTEKCTRTGAKIGLYPPLYTLNQYTNLYYTPYAADYITYADIERKDPIKLWPPQSVPPEHKEPFYWDKGKPPPF